MLRTRQIAVSAVALGFGVLVLSALRSGWPPSVWLVLALLLLIAGVYFLRRGP